MSTGFVFLIYKAADEEVSVNAVIKDDTIWLTQKSMSELFDVKVPAISKHLANIYEEGELNQDSTVSKMEIVQNEGSRPKSIELRLNDEKRRMIKVNDKIEFTQTGTDIYKLIGVSR